MCNSNQSISTKILHPALSFAYKKPLNQAIEWDPYYFKEGFIYEYHYYRGQEGYLPWNSFTEEILNDIVNQWEEVEAQLNDLFKERRTKVVKPLMEEGSVLFLSLLFWINGQPVNLEQFPNELKQLKVKPVNGDERLSFIMERLQHYPSFKQLKSLVEEQIKLAAKTLALRKIKR